MIRVLSMFKSAPRVSIIHSMRIIATGILYSMMISAYAANVSVSLKAGLPEIKISGPIVVGDDVSVREAVSKVIEFKHAHAGEMPAAILASVGGDVDTAMAIGRLLREAGASTESMGCFSACVLIYAGGVYRFPAIEIPALGLGIHRLYFSKLSNNETVGQIRHLRAAMLKRVAAYLSEMDISPELLDAMESYPPEQLHILSDDEQRKFRLSGLDTSTEEHAVALGAWLYGITSFEYRRRREIADSACPFPITSPTEVDLLNWSICQISTLAQVSKPEARRTYSLVQEKCASLSKKEADREAYNNCLHSVFTGAVR